MEDKQQQNWLMAHGVGPVASQIKRNHLLTLILVFYPLSCKDEKRDKKDGKWKMKRKIERKKGIQVQNYFRSNNDMFRSGAL